MKPELIAATLLQAIMAGLATQPDRTAHFSESKHLASLSMPVQSSGDLIFRHPSHVEKITLMPAPERIVIDGGQLTMSSGGGPPRVIPLDAHPALGALATTIVATLAGDLPSLQHYYTIDASGSSASWRLTMHPIDPAAVRFVRGVIVDGSGAEVHLLDIMQANGDTQAMTIEPSR